MKYSLYTIYDNETEQFSMPFMAATDKAAERQFMLNLSSLPEVVHSCMTLWQVCAVVDNLVDKSEGYVVCDGTHYRDWMKTHGQEVKE